MARPSAPRPETTLSKPRCLRPHTDWNARSRPANSEVGNGAKANCNSAPSLAGGGTLRPVAGLEGEGTRLCLERPKAAKDKKLKGIKRMKQKVLPWAFPDRGGF